MSAEYPIVSSSAGVPLTGAYNSPPSSWAPESPEEAPQAESPVKRVLGAIARYKWLTLALMVVGGAIGAVATRFIEPTYQTEARLWVMSPAPNKPISGPIRADELLPASSWVELFMSFAVADSVVAKRGLAATPDDARQRPLFIRFAVTERPIVGEYKLTIDSQGRHYTLARVKEGTVVDTGSVGDSIGRPVGFRWLPAPELLKPRLVSQFTVTTPRDASMKLLAQLQPTPVMMPNSQFLRVNLVAKDPVEGAATLNAWLDEFENLALVLKKKNVADFAKLLENQVQYASGELKAAESALERFRVETITKPSESVSISPGLQETRDPAIQEYFNRKIEHDDLRRLREGLQRALAAGPNAAEAVQSIPGLATQPGAQDLNAATSELLTAQANLRVKLQSFTEEHEQVKDAQRKVATLRNVTIPQAARALLNQFQQREGELTTRIASSSNELRGIPVRTIEEERLRRNKTVAEDLYKLLSSRHVEASLSERSTMPDVTTLDRASPAMGSDKFQKLKIIGTAILLALAVGIALSVLLDRMDHKFRHLSQVSADLGLAVLGTVPKIVQPPRRAKPEDAAEVVESFRGIRLRLQYAYSATQPLICGVTSPEQGDGKSLVAANLALAFAEAGYKTLLIDADTRRGALHEVFGSERRPGLIEVLSGEVPRADVLHATSQERLTLLPCGGRRTTNPELVASAALPRLLGELVQEFSVIIVDGPPLSAGIDAFAIGAACENTLMILRHSKTDMRMARAKLNLLRRLPLRTVGVVLNDVESMGDYKYYGYDATYRALPEERAVVTV